MSVGSIFTPLVLAGMLERSRFSRKPVGVDLSFFANWLFGHGCRQTDLSKSSHWPALLVAGAASATKTIAALASTTD